jgi:hypothetical protein
MEGATALESMSLSTLAVVVERNIVQNGLESSSLNTDFKREYNV